MAGVAIGPGNTITDVAGLRVGHAQRVGDGWRTGVTVVLPPPFGAVGGVDVRGAAPGTRETDLLDPRNLVERVHAVVLAGGSAYGLAAATGVVDRLAAAGVGFGVRPGVVVPIVPAAVVFDLGRGIDPRADPPPTAPNLAPDPAPDPAPDGDRGPEPGRPTTRGGHPAVRATPNADMGAAACDAGTTGPAAQGSVGAGTGAVAGGLAGGVGSASLVLAGGTTVGALVVVNAAGSPVDPASGELYAVRYGLPGEFRLGPPDPAEAARWRSWAAVRAPASFNTVIGVVATDANLTKAQCARLAGAGHDGLARAVRPAHTMADGDTFFALATGDTPTGAPAGAAAGTPTGAAAGADRLDELLAAGADVVTRAVGHAMLAASGRPGTPSYAETFPSAVAEPRSSP